MPIDLPNRFTRAWIERNVPTLSRLDADVVIAAMRAKGWSEEELQSRVYPHLRGRAAQAAFGPSRDQSDPADVADQERSRSPRLRRPSLIEVSAFAGILGSVAAVLAFFGFAGDNGDATPKAPARSGVLARTSSSAESTLRDRIPAPLRGTCSKDEALRKKFNAVAQYTCSLPGADSVVYLSYRTEDAMDRAYQPKAVPLSAGSCTEEWKVETSYRLKEVGKHVGLLKCYTHKGTAWMQWTRNDLLIYAYAFRQDGDRRQLVSAWYAAGPEA